MSNSAKGPVHTLRALSGQTVLYGVGTIGRQVVLLLSLPLFTRYLTQEQYGVVAVSVALLSFVDILSNAGLPAAVFRFYNDVEDDGEGRRVLGSSFLLFLAFAIGAAAIMIMFAGFFSQRLLTSARYGFVVTLCAVVLVVNTVVNFLTVLLRLQTRPIAVAVQGIVQAVLQVAFGVVLVGSFGLGAEGYWWGQLIGSVIGLALAAWLARMIFTLDWSFGWTRKLLAYGFPLIAETLAFWVLRSADRPILGNLLSLDQVAVYDVGYKIGFLVCMVVTPFQVAWPQFAYSAMKELTAPKTYERVFYFLIAGSAVLALGITVFSADLVRIFSAGNYENAAQIAPWIAFAMLFWGVYPVLGIGLMIAKKTRHVAWITSGSAVLNVLLNLVLIPRFGIRGSAISAFLGYLGLDIATYFVARKYYPLRLDSSVIVKGAVSTAVCIGIVWLANRLIPGSWMQHAISLISVALLAVVLFAMGGFSSTRSIREGWAWARRKAAGG